MTMATTITSVTAPIERRSVLRDPCDVGGPVADGAEGEATEADGTAAEDARALAGAAAAASVPVPWLSSNAAIRAGNCAGTIPPGTRVHWTRVNASGT